MEFNISPESTPILSEIQNQSEISTQSSSNLIGKSSQIGESSGILQKSSSNSTLQNTPEVIPLIGPGEEPYWVPVCSEELKPKLGMIFENLNQALKFYKAYAYVAGFNTRKSTVRKKNDVIIENFYVCNKAGYKNSTKPKTDNTKKGRKRLSNRVGCEAKMVVRIVNENNYRVVKFEEAHNHNLYTPSSRNFQKEGRNLNRLHKKMIMDNSKINVGPVQTYRQMKEVCGSYENIGATKIDFKNFNRDIRAMIDGVDGQMFIENFEKKQALVPSFFFDYELNHKKELDRAFWTDAIGRKNYALYGDMVSFDTTYKTNRYSLVFGPFTGLDNHKRCITFAACFISKEDIPSFDWVFKTFLRAMENNEPTCLITDQDPSMKVSVPKIFKKTKHRFCMWHIMKKMTEKIGRTITQETDFLEDINACVWSTAIEKEEFEEKWKNVLEKHNLEDHPWLQQLYELRDMWIPAYFRDLFLAGLMRTTSRSESENNFFTTFTNPRLTLVQFYMRYETAIDAQRHAQAKNDNDSKYSKPICKYKMKIEEHGSEVYTTTVFYEFQKQVSLSTFTCGLEHFEKKDDILSYTLSDKTTENTNHITFNTANSETQCSCKLFQKIGIPCKHMIWIWNSKMMESIPEQYVLNRWTILAARKVNSYLEGSVMQECAATIDKKTLLFDLWSEIHNCISLAQTDEEELKELIKNIQVLRTTLEDKMLNNSNDSTSDKRKEIEMLIGATIPTEIHIQQPAISKNKGTGVHLKNSEKRMKSDREKAIEKSQKNKRKCRGCEQLTDHDIRNCPLKKKTKKSKKA